MKIMLRVLLFFILIFNSLVQAQQIGNASYYSKKLYGHRTSDGGKYHPDSLTCAHRSYPFDTILKVRNPKNGNEVIVKVTDRGPRQRRLMIDLSYSAAKQLDFIRAGIAQVEITKLDYMPDKRQILSLIPVSVSEININIEPISINKFQFYRNQFQ